MLQGYITLGAFSVFMSNLSWDEYSILLAHSASKKSKDPWKKVGCCLLRHDNSVASLGYNGFPAGMEEDWSDRNERRKYVCHAEENALRYVRPGEVGLAASTLLPCNDCLKALAGYQVKRVLYSEIYKQDDSSLYLAPLFGIELVQIDLPLY